MGDIELLKIRLLRVYAYRCQIKQHDNICLRNAANIGRQPVDGWVPVCREHLEHGEGYV